MSYLYGPIVGFYGALEVSLALDSNLLIFILGCGLEMVHVNRALGAKTDYIISRSCI